MDNNNEEEKSSLHPLIQLALAGGGLFAISLLFKSFWGMIDFVIGFTLTLLAYFGFLFCSFKLGSQVYKMTNNSISNSGESIKEWFNGLISAELLSKVKERTDKKKAV